MDNAQYDRGVKLRMQLDQMVDTLNGIDVGMSLVWLWVWDIIRDKYKVASDAELMTDYIVTDDITLDIIWDKLWENPPADFTLEYGVEALDDAILDWMIDNDFLTALEDDGWLDDVANLEEANI